MKTDKLLQMITASDLPKPLSTYADVIGLDNVLKLTELAGGKQINIPKSGSVLRQLKKRLIIDEYKKGNCTLKSLSEKYEVCEKTVYNHIHSFLDGNG